MAQAGGVWKRDARDCVSHVTLCASEAARGYKASRGGEQGVIESQARSEVVSDQNRQ